MGNTIPAVPATDRTRSYLYIAETLRHEIRQMDVPLGARLPSERELAQKLQISRPSLREALIVLELQGEIEIRVGSGIYLRRNPQQDAPDTDAAGDAPEAEATLMGYSPREVNQMRLFLESSVAAHAARFATPAQVRALADCMQAMRTALQAQADYKSLADADRLFHTTLASITDNRLLVQTVEELFDQRYTPIGGSLHRLFDNQTVWEDAVREHQDIYDAVADHDPLRAQVAMQRHRSRAYARLMAVIGP